MERINPKVHIMDAGLAYYKSALIYEDELARVRCVMSDNGYIGKKTQVSNDTEGNLFMSFSNPFRTRYIKCRLSGPQDGAFAAEFKEGDKNTVLKLVALSIAYVLAVILAAKYFPWWLLVLCIIGLTILFAVFRAPSKLAQHNVRKMIRTLNGRK